MIQNQLNDGGGQRTRTTNHKGEHNMGNNIKVGDHVRWNSEAGHVEGKILKVHTEDTEVKGRMRRCSKAEPQYEIESDKTGHIAMHKGSALEII